jgi:hypothetical protein
MTEVQICDLALQPNCNNHYNYYDNNADDIIHSIGSNCDNNLLEIYIHPNTTMSAAEYVVKTRKPYMV